MITELRIENFRGFEKHILPFRETTIVVGKNNAGKSTIVEALRLISLITARYQSMNYSEAPAWTGLPRRERGISPSIEGLEINREGVFHRYGEPPARIAAKFSTGHSIEVYAGAELEVVGVLKNQKGHTIKSKSEAKSLDLPRVSILPQIGPILREEKLLTEDYVRQSINTARTSIHFRNQLHLLRQFFPSFKRVAEETWHGLAVKRLEVTSGSPVDRSLALFLRDGDFEAEVGWMGHGLQMWLQTMWFLSCSAGAGCVILDEPDIFMHADLQRRLIRLLKSRSHQTVVATHSAEIMAEVEPDQILVVDRKKARSHFAGKQPAVQNLLRNLGSIHNLQLARLAGASRFLMVEGDDVAILKRLQNTILPDAQVPIDSIPGRSIGGWNGWERAIGCASLLREASGDIAVYCLFDRDYHTPSEIQKRQKIAVDQSIQLHIWERKEIENYLLVPSAIHRVIEANRDPRKQAPTIEEVEAELHTIAEELRMTAFSGFATSFHDEDRGRGISGANQKAEAHLKANWGSIESKLRVIPGKEMVHRLSDWANRKFGASFSELVLARHLLRSEIDPEVADLLTRIETLSDFKGR